MPNFKIFINMIKEIENTELINLFNQGNNCSQIAKLFNCDSETIRLRLKKEGIDTSKKICEVKCVHCDGESRKEGKTKYGKQRYFCLKCDKLFVGDILKQKNEMIERHDKIKKMYLIDKLSTTEIADKLGVSSTVPQRILKKYGLTRNILTSYKLTYEKKYGVDYDEYLKKLPAFLKYKKEVYNLTKKQNIQLLLNYNKRGLCGINGAHQLDHKYSILEGFKNGVNPIIISNICNLEFIPWKENLKKGSDCSITLEKLVTDIQVRVK